MNPFVDVQQITKRFGNITALRKVSFTVEPGQIFGLIGPDGAGKTTLFRIIATLVLPDEGKVLIKGSDVVGNYWQIREIIGYMPGRFSLYQDLTVKENLEFFASVFRSSVQQNYRLIKPIYDQLKPFEERRAGNLSGGMKQKLALCCALIHKPLLLILDEPTTGVDAVSRAEFWEILHELVKAGITILVSTSYMNEASRCDRIALLQNGNILAIGSPDEIVGKFPSQVYSITSGDNFRLIYTLNRWEKTRFAWMFGQTVHWIPKEPVDTIDHIRAFLDASGIMAVRIDEISPNMEDCFMELMTE